MARSKQVLATFSGQFGSAALVAGAIAALSSCTDNKNFRLRQVNQDFVAATLKTSSQDFEALKGQDLSKGFSVTVGQDHTQGFTAAKKIDQKFDLLFVVDNSASMEESQEKLRKGFKNFAEKYMRPNWDIRVAAITTDTYLAHPRYRAYLNRPNAGFSQKSSYLKDKLAKLATSTPLDPIFDAATGSFAELPRPIDVVPAWGRDYGRLLPGIHDGPIASLCYDGKYEHQGDYKDGSSHCDIRETLAKQGSAYVFKYQGTKGCIDPGSSESSITQCVNTVLNDTVHSGRPIISTMPPSGTPADAAWEKRLLEDFLVNVSVSTAGAGSERGMSSVLQLLADNESSDSAFFREGSKRMIVFLSDEEDGSIDLDAPGLPADLEPEQLLVKDCDRELEGKKYSVPKCPKESDLLPVAAMKEKLDRFFRGLDKPGSAPNYSVSAIVTKKWSTLYKLHGNKTNGLQAHGERYMKLAEAVGNNSFSMDIGEANYSQILDKIGKTVAEGFRTFKLDQAPADPANLIVKILHEDKSETVVPKKSYTLVDVILTITDDAIVNQLKHTDRLVTESQAKKLDTFDLPRAPAPEETVTVELVSSAGPVKKLKESQYEITASGSKAKLRITDAQVVKKLTPNDSLAVKYEAAHISVCEIDHEPQTGEKVTVSIRHADGTVETLSHGQFEISGKRLTLTDDAVIKRYKPADKIMIHYELKLLNHFGLDRTPTGKEDMTVKLVRPDGSERILDPSQYEIREKTLVVTDVALAQSLTAQDRVLINYQPRYVFEEQGS
jgi:hypothetical protein